MKQLYVKQRIFSAAEKFTVTDVNEHIHYYVKGSLFNAPKTFEIQDEEQNLVAKVTKKTLAFLPKFVVETDNQTVEIKKDLTLFHPHYTFDPQNITVQGDIFEMNFSILNNKEEIATIHKKILSFVDAYEISIQDFENEQLTYENENLAVALVIAIDYMITQDRSNG